MGVSMEDTPGTPSTGAVEMPTVPDERTLEGLRDDGAPGTVPTVRFPTPGPVSVGDPDAVGKQRASLNLSDDPSGHSDYDWDPESVAPAQPLAEDVAPPSAEATDATPPAEAAPAADAAPPAVQ